MEKVKNFILTVIIGILIGSAGTYLYMERSSSSRIEQYRTTESSITEDNRKLREELQRYKEFSRNARDVLASQRTSIEKLREIIKNLPND